MLGALIRDLRHALRGLRTRPTYAAVTVLTLAPVIGAATAVVAVINATMFSPLPYPDADRLVRLGPNEADEVRDRGFLYARVGHAAGARNDLTRYLQLKPDADDVDHVREALIEAGSGKRVN